MSRKPVYGWVSTILVYFICLSYVNLICDTLIKYYLLTYLLYYLFLNLQNGNENNSFGVQFIQVKLEGYVSMMIVFQFFQI